VRYSGRWRRRAWPTAASLALVLSVACTLGGARMKPNETPSTKLALEFAKALASGDTARAHGFLSSTLRTAMTPEKLATDYREMVAYGSGAPTIIEVVTTMDAWPDKKPADAEWVYVAIANDTYSEAVTVVVSQEQSRLVIRSIEWGRP
jgi:hypothetical protein